MDTIMATTFRMSEKLEELLNNAISASGKSRSQIIREALEEYCNRLIAEDNKSYYEILMESGWKPVSSGRKNLATDKQLLRRLIHESADRRSC